MVVMVVWAHYKALLYKNWILWKRNWCTSCCELLFPLALMAIIVIIREVISDTQHDASSHLDKAQVLGPSSAAFPGFQPADTSFSACASYRSTGSAWGAALVPSNDPFIAELAAQLQAQPLLQGLPILQFATEEELEDYVTSGAYPDKVMPICFGVVFRSPIGPKYSYSIRFNDTESVPQEGQTFGDFIDVFTTNVIESVDGISKMPTSYQEQFIKYGFLTIQNIVDNLILKRIAPSSPEAVITPGFVPMYFDDYIDDSFMGIVTTVLPLFIIITYIIPVGRMIANTVQEKESRIKEVMMMMGMTNRAYWASWITYYFCLYSVLAGVITLITQVHVFKYSSGGFIFLYFWLFGISCIAFCFLIQTFFSRGRTAVIVGLMLFLVMYFISFAVVGSDIPESSKNPASLLPPIAFVLGANNLGNFEKGRFGVTADTANTLFQGYRFSTCLIMMVVDTLIFTVLGLYLEAVWPNEVGTKQPWHFPFTFWWRARRRTADEVEKHVKWGEDVEEVDLALEQQKDQNKAMLVRGLTKKFKSKVAVEDLNLDIYEGQIFALLGHNGAGKTTTISMLTGLIEPTKGEMTVHGQLLSKDLEGIRKKLGVCPQHNVLFNELTVREHLYVFSVFKGQTDKAVMNAKIQEIIEAVDIDAQKNVRADRLSGGQKRKLSLALALIGESPIVFLDEPTAGMDITARRQMWDMLKNNKAGRIILLTTHYMEEADILADRIAIISEGQLRCCGSALYLKARFGVGYYLNLVKEAGLMSAEHSKRVTQFVQGYVPSAVVMNDIPGEISYQMPIGEVSRFKDMFMELDHKLKELGLHSYGISVTTLEEVFLRVAQNANTKKTPQLIDSRNEPVESAVFETQFDEFYLARDRVSGSLFFRHVQALLLKRFLTNIRDLKSIACEIFVPIALVLLGLGLMIAAGQFKNEKEVLLSITDQYPLPQSVLLAMSPATVMDPGLSMAFKKDADIDVKQLGSVPLADFDKLLFSEKDTDPYRMGSIYFLKTDTSKKIYQPVIFHNQTAFQASATYYAYCAQAILQSINPEISVSVTNAPLPITSRIQDLSDGINFGFMSSVIFALGFAFIPTGIIGFIVREKELSVKHQHVVSGVSIPAYWVTNYIWDFSKHFIPAVICALFVLAFKIQVLTDPQASYAVLWLLMVLYGFSISTFTYFTSFFFKNASSSQTITLILNFIVGSILPSVILLLYNFEASRSAARALVWIFRIFPNFCFGMGLMNLGNRKNFAFLNGDSDAYEPFDIRSAGGDLLMMGITAIVYLLLLFIMEWVEVSPFLRQCLKSSIPNDMVSNYEPDEDVETEKLKAQKIGSGDAQVIVKMLRQVYRHLFSPPKLGVDEVSLTVGFQECFALLGVNGAGKTSTFRMLTGEYAPTAGDAYVGGHSVTTEMSKVRKVIGYCPQFDALNELLTGREVLEMYADLKGIPRKRRTELVDEILEEMDLMRYAKIRCGTYSGGNKRKLSVAMALLGNPSVVFLDEPSAGMDPEARKKMWKVIGNIKKKNSAVVLTTHSMEEAETLCDRIAIMVAGRLRCLGTATRIKNKFGSGYELEIKVVIPTERAIAENLQKIRFSGNLKADQIGVALMELGHPEYEPEISPKGRGAAIYVQMHLDKFVPATTLVAWVLTEEIGDNIYKFLSEQFALVVVVEHYLSFFKYKIERQEDRTLGFLFSCVETNKERLKVSEYSVTQTSLEQIFNQFARSGGHVEHD